MTKIIGLFADEQKAEEAINALATHDLDDVDFETITHWDRAPVNSGVEVAPILGSGSGPSGMPVAADLFPSWHLDEEEAEYFKRNVRNGGVLVVVDVKDEDQSARVRQILQESGEKVVTSS